MTEDPSSSAAAGTPVATSAPPPPAPPAGAATDLPTRRDGWLARLRTALARRGGGSLREDLASALADDLGDPTTFTPRERVLLQNILRLREVRVDDVMVPRADIQAVEVDTPLAELVATFSASGHSRLPVYRETLDDPIGMVLIKDLTAKMFALASLQPEGSAEGGNGNGNGNGGARYDLSRVDLSRPLSATKLVRPVLFVPPSMPATDLMAKMQSARVQMALVIDEYGGTDGLVSLEDLVETVVGDIEDEHDVDDDEATITPAGEGAWIADARVDLEAVQAAIGPDFDPGEMSEEVDTIGGLVFAVTGRIPVRGELISPQALPGFEFEVLDADTRRIRRLKIARRRPDGRSDARRRGGRRGNDVAASASA
jgi:CBS domain containing-hemolysin-like protein